MKKSLLLLVCIVTTALASWAVTDNQTYETINGLQMKNQWIFDRVHAGEAYLASPICHQRARTAVMNGGVIYVARSEEALVVNGTDTLGSQSIIHRFSVEDGSALEDLPLTLDGSPYVRFLGVTSIGADNFGHIWVAPMTSNVQTTVPVYMVNTETGELTLVVEMQKGEMIYRTDYLDVVGDLTLQQAECNIMTVAGSSERSGFPTLYRMHADKNGEWEGGFEGDPYMDVTNFYPETKTGFSLAPVIKMLLGDTDEDRYAGQLFYIDCFDTDPVLYDLEGNVIDNFENVDMNYRQTDKGANGACEFTVDGRNFLVYPKAQYDKAGNGCQAYIAELGESKSLTGLNLYWQAPADSLGKVSDSGLRVHCLNAETSTDASGNEVVTLFTFKAYNGMGIYKIGKNLDSEPTTVLTGDVNLDGKVDSGDIACIVNIITGKDAAGTYGTRDDVNGDAKVDSGDIAAVVAIITGN